MAVSICILTRILVNSWKVDFHPNGNEVLTGATSLTSYDVSTGAKSAEVGMNSKYIMALAYVI